MALVAGVKALRRNVHWRLHPMKYIISITDRFSEIVYDDILAFERTSKTSCVLLLGD